MKKAIPAGFLLLGLLWAQPVFAQEATQGTEATVSAKPKPDLTEPTEEQISQLRMLLLQQDPGQVWTNPVKHAIRSSVETGVPVNTIVLLLLLPLVVALIASARHIIGLRGFGIFLPAALSVVFVATGPVLGLTLFLIIVIVSTGTRILLRRFRVKLQYLPRMALILWVVVLGVLALLFAAPILQVPEIVKVSIFPILFLVLLAEDFTRAQIGKSARTAINLTSETLILALASFGVLTFPQVQEYALLHPEQVIVGVAIFNFLIGKYVGLRFLEFWRFRRLISG